MLQYAVAGRASYSAFLQGRPSSPGERESLPDRGASPKQFIRQNVVVLFGLFAVISLAVILIVPFLVSSNRPRLHRRYGASALPPRSPNARLPLVSAWEHPRAKQTQKRTNRTHAATRDIDNVTSSTTTATLTTTASAMLWQTWKSKKHVNCRIGVGAEAPHGFGRVGVLPLEACLQTCKTQEGCEAVIFKQVNFVGQCWLRSNVVLSNCLSVPGYELWYDPVRGLH